MDIHMQFIFKPLYLNILIILFITLPAIGLSFLQSTTHILLGIGYLGF